MRQKKTLVAMDGSAPALRALRLAAKERAPLVVLNVQLRVPRERFIDRAVVEEHYQRGADEALAAARSLIKRWRLKAETVIAIGEPATTIVSFADRHRCTSIVMGTRGKGAIARLLLGSVAERVIQLASCPVTVVK
jgi:nucleotide-binding universal stress UspA family protein